MIQYLDYARQTPVYISGGKKLRHEIGRRSRTYQKEGYRGYAAEFAQDLENAIVRAPKSGGGGDDE